MHVAAGRIVWINNGDCQLHWNSDVVLDRIKAYGFGNGLGHGNRYFSC